MTLVGDHRHCWNSPLLAANFHYDYSSPGKSLNSTVNIYIDVWLTNMVSLYIHRPAPYLDISMYYNTILIDQSR